MSTLQSYLSLIENNTPLNVSQGSNITNRTENSPDNSLPDGATSNQLVLGTSSHTTTSDMILCDDIVTPLRNGGQSLQLPALPKSSTTVTEIIVPPISNLVIGNGNPSEGFNAGDSNSPNYGVSMDSLQDNNSSSLPYGTVVGDDNWSPPENVLFSSFYQTGGESADVLGDICFRRVGNGSDSHGSLGNIRHLSEISNAANPNNQATNGWGVQPLDLLSLLQIVSTSTVSSTEPDSKMKFTIKKGSNWPGDKTFKKISTGNYLESKDLTDNVDSILEVFIEDWEVDTSVYQIVESFSLTNSSGPSLLVKSGTKLETDITVSASIQYLSTNNNTLASLVSLIENQSIFLYFPSGSGLGANDDNYGSNLGYHGTDQTDRDRTVPSLKFVICPNTVYGDSSQQYMTKPLTKLQSGFVVPSGTNVSQVDDTNWTNLKVFSTKRVVLKPGYKVVGGAAIARIITNSREIQVSEFSQLVGHSELPVTSSWNGDLSLESVDIPPGYIAPCDILFNENCLIRSALQMSNGSSLESGSIVPTNTTTDKGMLVNDQVSFSTGSSINSDFDFRQEIYINQLVNGNVLPQNCIIRSSPTCKTSLPNGMVITNKNYLPSHLRININDGVSLLEGFIAMVGTKVGQGFMISNSKIQSGAEIPKDSYLSPGVLLPSETSIPKDSRFDFDFPLPMGYTVAKNTKLPKRMRYGPNANLPSISARSQENVSEDPANGNTPYRIINAQIGGVNNTYIVFISGTSYTRGFNMPKGTVILNTQNLDSCTPNSASFANGIVNNGSFIVDNNVTVNFDEGTFSYINLNAGYGTANLTLTAGVPLTTGISLNGSTQLMHDLAVPLVDSSAIFSCLSFNVNFILQKDAISDSDYTVSSNGNVFWPSGTETPSDFSLDAEFLLTSGTELKKPIKLPVVTSDYLENVLSVPNSYIRTSTKEQTTMKFSFQVLSGGLSINNTDSHSYIDLLTGTKVLCQFVENNSTIQGLKLKANLSLDKDWEIESTITTSPAFIAQGIWLPEGSSLPGTVVIGSSVPFPSGLSLVQPAQLSRKLIINSENSSEKYSIPQDLYVRSNSLLKKGSVFVNACRLSNVTLKSCEFNNQSGLYLLSGEKITSSLHYNLFYGQTPIQTNDSYLVDKVSELELIVDQQQKEIESLMNR